MTRGRLAFMLTSTAAIVLLVAAAVFADVTPKNNIFRNLSIFTEVFSIVRDSYVEPVPQEQLVDGAFVGVTDAIDEFSYYVPPARMADWKRKGGDQSPRGAVVSRRFGYGYVIAAVAGSPADRAGLKAGDLIDSIDGTPAARLSPWEIRAAVAGDPRSPVKLAVLRDGETERVEVTIPGGGTESPLPGLSQEGEVAVLEIPGFGEGTANRVAELLTKIPSGEPLVIDVRRNADGRIDEAIATADLLLEKGLLAELKGQRIQNRTWKADADAKFRGRTLVVVDGTTSGAAEIFAAALQGNKRATVVGRPTYGRAIEQQMVELPSGGGLWMTVGHYSAPEGKVSGTRGLRPDEMVDMTPLLLDSENPSSEQPDLIMLKALELARTPRPSAAA